MTVNTLEEWIMRKSAIGIMSISMIVAAPAISALNNKAVPTAQVVITPNESSNFSLQFNIKNNNSLRNHWGLGFFMFHVLAKPSNKLNIRLCTSIGNICVPMKVINSEDKIVGHVNLIAPATKFSLQYNKPYTIIITGLTNPPRNISAMPQQLFLYNFNNKTYTHLKLLSYINKTYNAESAQKQIESIVLTRWNNYESKSNKSYIVPTPVAVAYESGFNIGNNLSLVSFCDKNVSYSIQCRKIVDKPEGYVLKIESQQINIYANNQAGVFYAHETLKQLQYLNGRIPLQTIVDYPRFKYRGIMLDTARHFFTVAEIRKLLDVMGANKLNTLHLHLADDEGWRIELPNYKKLTQIGGQRGGHSKLPASNLINEKIDVVYKGAYSVADIKNLIQYANERQITIIPEIEMPGHALSLKIALPIHLIEKSDSSKYMSIQGYTNNVLPVCKYNTDQKFTTTINNITKDVAKLFDHQTTLYAINNEISLSGDEVPNDSYSGLAQCKSNTFANLDTEGISHQYFKLMSENFESYKLSGWQQIVQRDDGRVVESFAIPANQVGHVWAWLPTTNTPVSGYTMVTKLLKSGYKVVVDFANYTYFDLRSAPLFFEPGLYWANNYTDTYSAFDLGNAVNKLYKDPDLSESDISNLLGIEGAMWSELISSKEVLWYMMLPKMTGLAEAAWAQKSDLNWHTLALKLGCGKTGFLNYLNQTYGVKYRGYPNGIKLEVPPSVCKVK